MQDRQVTGLPLYFFGNPKQVVEEEDADFSSSAANIFWPRVGLGDTAASRPRPGDTPGSSTASRLMMPCLSESAEGKQ